jgi:hypothetical protein
VAENTTKTAEALAAQTHELKTDPGVFDAVAAGLKTFEIRRNDRGFRVGDTLVLRRTQYSGAAMAQGEPLVYTGESLKRSVSHVLHGPAYGLADGWVILSLAAQPQAEPVAAEAIHYADLTPDEAIGWPDRGTAEDKNRYLRDVTERRKSLAARPPVAAEAAAGLTSEQKDKLLTRLSIIYTQINCIEHKYGVGGARFETVQEQLEAIIKDHGLKPLPSFEKSLPVTWVKDGKVIEPRDPRSPYTYQAALAAPVPVAPQPVAQQGAAEAVAEVRDGAIYSAKYNIKLAVFTRGASLPAGPLYAAPVAVAAQPVAQGLTDDERAAVEFYILNPSAAVIDVVRRFKSHPAEGDTKSSADEGGV